MAESVNGLYKGELIRRHGPWRSVEDVELATLSWVHWWNHQRIHSSIGNLSPDEFERATNNPVGEPLAGLTTQ
jgi:putative transposase